MSKNEQNLFEQNKYAQYKTIRYNRTYKTLGKMGLWRVVAGILLLVYVLLMSGFVSDIFASREEFKTANALMIAPNWMEKYRPDVKAFYAAGLLYEAGELEAALESFDRIEGLDSAYTMSSVCRVALAEKCMSDKDYKSAFEYLYDVDIKTLGGDYLTYYCDTCTALHEYCAKHTDELPGMAQKLVSMLDAAREYDSSK